MNWMFFDDSDDHGINIDLVTFENLLSEYAASFDRKKMALKMKEILRDEVLLSDFLERLGVDLSYLIILSYKYNPKVLTPQLVKELNCKIRRNKSYPFKEHE